MTNLSSLFIPTALSILFSPILSQVAVPLNIVISEIAWMGTKTSYNDEWMEIYNNTGSEVNLSGWKLITKDGTPEINLSGIIPAESFYLLERTNDDTVPGIAADQIYSGPMGNGGEEFLLYDSSGNLIDSLDCTAGWFAGDNTTKQTMERKDSSLPGNIASNWSASQNPGGTPKAKNSFLPTIETTLEPPKDAKPALEKQPAPEEKIQPETANYPKGIIFNEILPSPKGKDEEEEWIEIKNQSDFEVDLSGWKISDTAGSVTVYTFPEGTKIKQKGFLLISRPETKITLNNSGDGLKLIQPDKNILDSINYENAQMGNSYSLLDDQWVWSNTPTPGFSNVLPPSDKENNKIISTEEKDNLASSSAEKLLASAEKQILAFKNQSLPFLAALALAIISGVSILFFKKNLAGKLE